MAVADELSPVAPQVRWLGRLIAWVRARAANGVRRRRALWAADLPEHLQRDIGLLR